MLPLRTTPDMALEESFETKQEAGTKNTNPELAIRIAYGTELPIWLLESAELKKLWEKTDINIVM
jgi:hypothetical protein